MADDSDVDNELEKESVKKGRRAKAAIQNKKEVTCEDGNSQDSFEGKECNGFPGRRIADWNEINVPHGVSFGRRAQTNLQNICDLSQKQESDEELEIPIIPDVCSAEESVVDSKSAVPPNVVINRIPSYRELNQDLINHGTIPVLDSDINLSVLEKHLFSEAELKENDETWDWDRLFAALACNEFTGVK